jgi:hypothetical protein
MENWKRGAGLLGFGLAWLRAIGFDSLNTLVPVLEPPVE